MVEQLDNIFASLGKEDDTLVAYSDTDVGLVRSWAPTFLPSLDKVMLGGIPISGKITEIYGDNSVGKSTFVARIISILQSMQVSVVYFDTEMTQNRERLEELGVDPSKIFTIKQQKNRMTGKPEPLTIESISSYIIDISTKLHKKYPDNSVIFVWDTVAETLAGADAKKDIGDQTVGQSARALSESLRKVVPALEANGAGLIALNQARADIGGNPMFAKMQTYGGKALQHAYSLRLEMKAGKTLKDSNKEEYGHIVKLKFVKSKIGDNGGMMNESILLSHGGFDLYYNTLNDACEIGIVQTSGAFKSYISDNGESIKFQGFDKFYNYLISEEGQEVFNEIWKKVCLSYFPTCYPPLFNLTTELSSDRYPFLDGLKEYYIMQQENIDDNMKHTTYKLWKESHEKDVANVMKVVKKASKTVKETTTKKPTTKAKKATSSKK